METQTNFSLHHHFIETPQARRVFARIGEVHQDTLRSKTSKGLLVQGFSGSGKTTTVREYLSSAFPTPDIPGQLRRAVHVEIPSSPSKKNLAAAMLMSLGDPFAESRNHSAEAKFTRIVTLLKNLKTEIVFMDEAQHLIDYKRTSTYEAADWIKSLMNESSATFVLVGLKRTQQLLYANEQLRRRFSASVDFERFSWATREEQQDFAALLNGIHSVLPVPAVEFVTEDLLLRFHHASFGLIDYLIKILDRAVWLVQVGRAEGIDRKVLADAFSDEVWANVPQKRNPFADAFDFSPLIGCHEPFEGFDSPKV